MTSLSKTIESVSVLSSNHSDMNQSLNTVGLEIYTLINEIGTKGDWYVYDSIVMTIVVSYNQTTDKTLTYDIQITDDTSIERLNNWYLTDFTPEQRKHQGIHLVHPMKHHVMKCLKKVVGLIQDTYYENNEPTSGNIVIKTTATYEPEIK